MGRIKEGLVNTWYDVKHFFINIYIFRKQLREFRPWDSSYNMELFAKSLDITGNHMIRYGICVHSVRHGRRAKAAARMLLSASEEKNTDKWKRVCASTELRFTGTVSTRFKISSVRQKHPHWWVSRVLEEQQHVIKNRYTEAFNFTNKYIRNWWD